MNLTQPWHRLVALCCLALAFVLCAQHPVAPWAAAGGVAALVVASARHRNALAFLLPALLPVASFMPWTGWWLLDESDLLVLALAAGGYARWSGASAGASRSGRTLWWMGAAVLLAGWARGWADATALEGAVPVGWLQALYADHASAWNTVRVSKALLWCLLLAPLWARLGPDGPAWLARGMVAGLALVCAVVLWERALLVGLFDVTEIYRTTAWFWEMQVGGGAIDMYLAMALPFAVWALWTARSGWPWVGALALFWVAVYAVLTTYSRGIALASLILLGWMAWAAWRHPLPLPAASARASATLALALLAVVVQAWWVVDGGQLRQRMARADVDLRQRAAHWQAGLSLLQSPTDALLGLGAGRWPARHASGVPGGELPGRSFVTNDGSGGALVLSGPPSRNDLGGRWTLSQRVGHLQAGAHTLRVRLSGTPGAVLQVALCERHLLDAMDCRWIVLSADVRSPDGWQVVPLPGHRTADRAPWRTTLGVLQLHVPDVGQVLRVDAIELIDPLGRSVLRNGDFQQGVRHWMGIAEGYYQPWHIDNLFLDVLIERGMLGWLWAAGLLWWAVRGLWSSWRAGDAVAWALSGALVGILALGAVISVTEFPRLVLLLGALLCVSAHKHGQKNDARPCKRL